MVEPISTDKYRNVCDPEKIALKCTNEVKPLDGIIGQDRALRALKFGIEIKDPGFNVYVSGIPGTGKRTAIMSFLNSLSKEKPKASDWCYVNNFGNQYEPKAIRLPAGKGTEFSDDMGSLIQQVRRMLPKVFESEDYATRKESTVKLVEEERAKLFAELNADAQKQGFVIQSSPMGLITIPVVNGRPLREEEFMALPQPKKDEIQHRREQLNAEMRSAFRQLRELDSKVSEEVEKLNRDVSLMAIGHLVSDLKEKYKDLPEILKYIDDVQNDILENLDVFIGGGETQPQLPPQLQLPYFKELPFKKYEVNVIVNNSKLNGAPVVEDQNPSYPNLLGRIERELQFGVAITDFTMIRSGSLHKANGGYLFVQVEDLLRNPYSWEGLKTALRTQQVSIEDPAERAGYVASRGLKPEPIPLDIKILIMGTPDLFMLLLSADPDFSEFFKVKADFDTTMDRTLDNIGNYSSFMCTLCRDKNLNHLDVSAVAKMIEYGSRLAEDQTKLSTRFASVADVIREANFYAVQDNEKYITAKQVMKAIDEKIYRSNLIQTKIQEMMTRNVYLIDTEGAKVGQVNGLSVESLGDFEFGRPSRVTASIGIGREGIIDIEREVAMAGPIYSKGVMILGGYLAGKYAQDKPLTLAARLVFEQSYGGVEGDSASSTEVYAMLSALSGLPIRQSLAVTGSVNQKGEVQAIGGVNEKLEGFYEVCKAKGLTGEQGAMIPASNVQNLMLKEELLEAGKAGKFRIYAVSTIDEGIEVLTGVKAGERRPDGTYPEGTVNYLVDKKLREMADKMKEFQGVR
jgi:lon-related putative ATP-dependent protease